MSGLIVWLTWIDDCLIAGDKKGVKAAKEQMKQRFECDDVGSLTEYVGCKVQRNGFHQIHSTCAVTKLCG